MVENIKEVATNCLHGNCLSGWDGHFLLGHWLRNPLLAAARRLILPVCLRGCS